MTIIKKTSEKMTITIYEIKTNDGVLYYLRDFINENGRVVDTILSDENGVVIDDPILLEEIDEMISEEDD